MCSGVLRTRARSPGCFVSVWVFCACLYDLYMPVCFVYVCALCASVRYVHVNVLCLLVCISVRLCMCKNLIPNNPTPVPSPASGPQRPTLPPTAFNCPKATDIHPFVHLWQAPGRGTSLRSLSNNRGFMEERAGLC